MAPAISVSWRAPRERLLLLSISLASCAVVGAAALAWRRRHASRLLSSEPAKSAEMARVGLKPAFARRLAQLIVFRERVGHADVPLGSSSGSGLVPVGLGKWVYEQRRRKAEGKIDRAEEAALDETGFRWVLDAEELDWDEMLGRLVAWKAQTGDCLVPKKCEAEPLLGAWVAMCRRKADPLLNGGDKSAFPQEKRDALDAVGFCWEPENRCGSVFMKGLRAFGEAHMAGKPPPDEGWCKLQREARANGKLSQQRIQYLDSFGFCWVDASDDFASAR